MGQEEAGQAAANISKVGICAGLTQRPHKIGVLGPYMDFMPLAFSLGSKSGSRGRR